MAGSEDGPASPGPSSGAATLVPVAVAIAFFAAAVIAAGFGKYVMSLVSLISGLAILSYIVEVGRHGR